MDKRSTHINETRGILPIEGSKRYLFLDSLRGFALLGVCLANYPEFSLYSFQTDSAAANLPGASVDKITNFLMYLFVDGKFYTLFSLLFGIGFSIIISKAAERGANGLRIFYRRMTILALIGCTHLMLIWSGDILLLYAILGMILPLLRKWSDKKLIITSIVLLAIPVVIDGICEISNLYPAQYPYNKWWEYAGMAGITQENFGIWLRDADSYGAVHRFLIQGAWERLYEFVDGNRYFKVMGLFVIGFEVGRHKIYADLNAHRRLLKRVVFWGLCIGLPLSLLYAYSGTCGHCFGKTLHTVLYTLSVYPLGFAYASLLGLICIRHSRWAVWKWFAWPGRMALTNYIGQSLIGMWLFYGIGVGLGASLGLTVTDAVACIVFISQILFSKAWLRLFRFGPLEWVWRMLTYGKWLNLIK